MEQSFLEDYFLSRDIPHPFAKDYSPLVRFVQSEREEFILTDKESKEALSAVPEAYRNMLSRRMEMLRGWVTLKKQKLSFASLVASEGFFTKHPWCLIEYSLPVEPINLSAQATPLVFLSPVASDYTPILEPLKNRPAVFVFETYGALCQMLRFPNVVKSLCAPDHLLYSSTSIPTSSL